MRRTRRTECRSSGWPNLRCLCPTLSSGRLVRLSLSPSLCFCVCVCLHAHTSTHARTRTHIHTQTHTHTHSLSTATPSSCPPASSPLPPLSLFSLLSRAPLSFFRSLSHRTPVAVHAGADAQEWRQVCRLRGCAGGNAISARRRRAFSRQRCGCRSARREQACPLVHMLRCMHARSRTFLHPTTRAQMGETSDLSLSLSLSLSVRGGGADMSTMSGRASLRSMPA